MAEQLDGVKVRDLTWFGVAHAGADMDADSMIWQRSRLGEAGAVAVDANDDGRLDGLVLEDQLWAVPVEQRALMMLNADGAVQPDRSGRVRTTTCRRCCPGSTRFVPS